MEKKAQGRAYHALFCNMLEWTEGSLSPQDCCAVMALLCLSERQGECWIAVGTEVGVLAGEGGPWCCLRQLPSPALEEALLGKFQ